MALSFMQQLRALLEKRHGRVEAVPAAVVQALASIRYQHLQSAVPRALYEHWCVFQVYRGKAGGRSAFWFYALRVEADAGTGAALLLWDIPPRRGRPAAEDLPRVRRQHGLPPQPRVVPCGAPW